jgi:hypothetical protein
MISEVRRWLIVVESVSAQAAAARTPPMPPFDSIFSGDTGSGRVTAEKDVGHGVANLAAVPTADPTLVTKHQAAEGRSWR